MKTINDLPPKTFWQPEAKIKESLKELGVEAVKELEQQHRYNASECIREIFDIKEFDIDWEGSDDIQ